VIRLRGSDTRVESERYNSAYVSVKIHVSVDTTKGTALGQKFVLLVKQRVLHFVLFYCIVLVRVLRMICILYVFASLYFGQTHRNPQSSYEKFGYFDWFVLISIWRLLKRIVGLLTLWRRQDPPVGLSVCSEGRRWVSRISQNTTRPTAAPRNRQWIRTPPHGENWEYRRQRQRVKWTRVLRKVHFSGNRFEMESLGWFDDSKIHQWSTIKVLKGSWKVKM
jgi:hypothetical protein